MSEIQIIIIFSGLLLTDSKILVWKSDLSIGSDNLDDDLERISADTLASLNLQVDDSKLERFHYLVRDQQQPEYSEPQLDNYDYQYDYRQNNPKQNETEKRQAKEKLDYDTTLKAFVNGSIKEFDYDLEQFKKEYDSVTLGEPDIKTISYVGDMTATQPNDEMSFEMDQQHEYSKQCIEMKLWKFIFFGPNCFLHEVSTISGKGKVMNVIIMAFKILLVWLLVYVVAVPIFWLFNGSCCCCLKFNVLHPYQATKKLKTEVLKNPPGIYINEDGSETHYTPSDREVAVYRKVMRLIYS